MDLEEWELLSDDGFLVDLHDDGGGKKISHISHSSNSKNVFNMNYFICPSLPPSLKFIKPINPKQPSQLVPDLIQLDPSLEKAQDGDILEKNKASPTPSLVGTLDGDQENLPKVFFKKMKENQFVDMKMDSPKSSSKGIMLQIDPGKFQFDDKSEAYIKGDAMEIMPISPKMTSSEKEMMVIKPISPKMTSTEKEMVIKNFMDSDPKKEDVNWEGNNGGLNIWKWSLTGVGALCSIGVAGATICILIFGNSQRNKHQQKNQKLRFQIYTDDKRIKQVVHHTTRFNEAISAARGVPLTRAHITFGGYYDGL